MESTTADINRKKDGAVAPLFSSFVLAGFECTYALTQKGRLDVLAATRHDEECRRDYWRIRNIGITAVREGLSWSQIDLGKGNYDFSRFENMMRIGHEEGIGQIWDLNHFDYPERLDPFSADFAAAYAEYALAAARTISRYSTGDMWLVPWNEMSFFSWIAGEEGKWAPFAVGTGFELKQSLVRASVAAMNAIRSEYPNAKFMHTDPVMRRKPRQRDKRAEELAIWFNDVKFQTFDMLMGRLCPELGGHPDLVDAIGANYYYNNQEWVIKDKNKPGDYTSWAMAWGSKHRLPVSHFLKELYDRYGKDIVLAETGSFGSLRAKWWRKMLAELNDASAAGIPLRGVCAYPVIDYPDWFGGHLTNSGLWDFEYGDASRRRIPQERVIGLVKKYVESTRCASGHCPDAFLLTARGSAYIMRETRL